MAHPINSIDYLLNQWEYLKNRYSYYAFFLFTEEHEAFCRLFQESMLEWDQLSGDGTMFFAIAPPPKGWEELAGSRQYWRYYHANSHRDIAYDADAVKQAARYFYIPSEELPGVVLFSDLQQYDKLAIHLVGLSPEEAGNLVANCFTLLNRPAVRRYRDLWRIHPIVDRLPLDRRVDARWVDRLVDIAWDRGRSPRRGRWWVGGERLRINGITVRSQSTQRIEATLQGLEAELRRLSDEVAFLREEQRQGFREVNVRLEQIEVVLSETVGRIRDYRAPFVTRWMNAELQGNTQEEIDAIRNALQAEFDVFILAQSAYLAQRLPSPAPIPRELQPWQDTLEPNSLAALQSSETLWQYFVDISATTDIDYSVCGIGLWKALEIELNRTFADALRVFNGLCQAGTASVEQRVKRLGRLIEDGRVGAQVKPVRINCYVDDTTDKLKGIMLYDLGALVTGTDLNNLDRLLPQIPVPLSSDDSDYYSLMTKLGQNINYVRLCFRNSHAHMQLMSRVTYEEFREFMLDDTASHNPLIKTLELKREFDAEGLI